MKTWPDERYTYTDPDTGAEVTRLTSHRGNSNHLYFTNNSFYDEGRRIVFQSDRDNAVNLFSMELATGEIEQLTDIAPLPYPKEYSLHTSFVDGVRATCCFFAGDSLMLLDLKTKEVREIYRMPPKYRSHITSITADGKYVLTSIFEDTSDRIVGKRDVRKIWETQPHSQILRIPVDGGAPEVLHEGIYLAHVNASPTDPDLFTFCHEGAWNQVDHRLWLMNIASGEIVRLHPCGEGEVIGHEYWYADGRHIGYHGHKPGARQLGRISWDGKDDRAWEFPFNTGHIFSRDERLIVGDGERSGRYLRLWRLMEDGYEAPRALCLHDCTFKRQRAHVHPAITPDGRAVLYTSDESGYEQVYLVRIPDDLTSLPMLDTLSKY
ncbi:MAG: PD40 domain-containing protein [Clostridia bacterium]|nr:PD40 domain-containing protein [Clostridia bacterium]